MIGEHPGVGFEAPYGRVRTLAHLFLFYSIIVSRQV
jgi:hypothetical protein